MEVEKRVYVSDDKKVWVFLLVFSLVVMAIGVYIGFIKSAGYVKTTGVVVDHREETRYDSDLGTNQTYYYPIVQYIVDGVEYTGTLDINGWSALGEEVKIQYDPDDPSKVHSYSPLVTILIFVVAAPFFVLALIKLIKSKKKAE
ncbi:MAG: DUF3592 domain-containing protein [Lachnospiraceae bacterium]|nr:DUF3592 domain-containing protein [Lachnospiraceae bacterium]